MNRLAGGTPPSCNSRTSGMFRPIYPQNYPPKKSTLKTIIKTITSQNDECLNDKLLQSFGGEVRYEHSPKLHN